RRDRAGEYARVGLGRCATAASAGRRRRRGEHWKRADRVRRRGRHRQRRSRRACTRHAPERPRALRPAGLDAAASPGLVGHGGRQRNLPPAGRPRGLMSGLDPIELQVLTGALRAACEEMGVVLIRSAHSANIKERRDASTALCDAAGGMIMQAEHIPVHLGSMPAAVAAVLDERHAPGVSWILNDPFAGGTHLPDITVITPIFAERDPAGGPSGGARGSRAPPSGELLLGYAASRAHHADVGGRVPGSMPADSRLLSEEGGGVSPPRPPQRTLEQLVARMRQPQERRADLRAQLAANRTGALRLAGLARRIGPERLREGTDAVLDYAEQRTRACLAELGGGAVS